MIVRSAIPVAACLTLAFGAFAQTSTFDGVYRGEAITGNGCSLWQPVLRVENGTATMHFNSMITFEGKVGNDGSLSAPFGKSSLFGKFTGGKFQGSASAGRCQYPLTLAK